MKRRTVEKTDVMLLSKLSASDDVSNHLDKEHQGMRNWMRNFENHRLSTVRYS
jgi:hypothetical protein